MIFSLIEVSLWLWKIYFKMVFAQETSVRFIMPLEVAIFLSLQVFINVSKMPMFHDFWPQAVWSNFTNYWCHVIFFNIFLFFALVYKQNRILIYLQSTSVYFSLLQFTSVYFSLVQSTSVYFSLLQSSEHENKLWSS